MRHVTPGPPASHPRTERPLLAFGATAMTSLFALAVLALAGLTACGSSGAIPPDAQVVHVTVTQSEVRLEPASVRAGDVYLVLDGPIFGVHFVQQAREFATPGPLSDADLARLEQGDWEFTYGEAIMVSGCAADQRAAMRGRQGQCGNVFKIVVIPGTYAVVGGGGQSAPEGGPIMAVLRVEP